MTRHDKLLAAAINNPAGLRFDDFETRDLPEGKSMNDFDGFDIHLLIDEDGDWIAHFIELSNASAGGVTPEQALQELRVAWRLVKDSYQAGGERIPTPAIQRAA